MSNLPPDTEDSADIDALYRRLSAADPSQPGEAVRHAVLVHAMRQARPAANDPALRRDYSWQRRERAWLRPTTFGALAAGILAVFLFGPRFSMQPQVSLPVVREDRAADTPPVYADITSSELMKESAAPASDAKVRQVPQDALRRRQLTVPPAADTVTANTVAAGAAAPTPAEQPLTAAARAEASGSLDATRAKADAAPAAAAGTSASANTTTAAVGTPPARLRDDSSPMLWRAAESGDVPALRDMHEKHVNLNATDAVGRTALLIATLHGHSQAVSALLDYGADPNISDARGVSPLDAALAADESEIIAALKRHGAR